MKKKAIITGITGQDGSYLAELLLKKNYKIYGLKRRTASEDLGNVRHLKNEVEIIEGDLLDYPSIYNMCKLIKPNEFYNLAAQSHVGTSFKQPIFTYQVNGLGVLHCLEALKQTNQKTKFYQASTSEMFGGINGEIANTEETPLHPRSPYGIGKLAGYWHTINYRESYNMFACAGFLHNHESPRRGNNFVTRKITLAIASIYHGRQEFLELGNLSAKRDWGHAKDYVSAMHLMLQQKTPDDFVVATGKTFSVEDFCRIAFEHAGFELNFTGEGLDKVGVDQDGIIRVKVNPKFYRPAEVHNLIGDYSKAKKILKWKPQISFKKLVQEMAENDINSW